MPCNTFVILLNTVEDARQYSPSWNLFLCNGLAVLLADRWLGIRLADGLGENCFTFPSPVSFMRRVLDEPPIEPIRSYFSQLCVMLTGIASGGIEAVGSDAMMPSAFHMGRRDGYHVVVAHLAASASLREAADKCEQFGLGVAERAEAHPYGPDWSQGFAHATLDAVSELAMYAATATVPLIDRRRLEAARAAVRHTTPAHALRNAHPGGIDAIEPPAHW